MKKTLWQLLAAFFISAFIITGCSDNLVTGIDPETPEPERLTISGDMPFQNGVFTVQRNLPANFTANASAGFVKFTWWARFNTNPNDSAQFNHKDFTYTWGSNGWYTMKLRGYRADNTFRDTSYQVNVVDTVIGGGDSLKVFKVLPGTFNTSTGKWINHFQLGSKYSKFYSHIPYNPSRYKPGLVIRTATSYKVIPVPSNGLDTADNYWDIWFETPDSLITAHVVRYYDTTMNPNTWDHANITGSEYYRDFGNGDKFLYFGMKDGLPVFWNQFVYTRPGNQGNIHVAWSSDQSGANRIVYFDIREVIFLNINELYWVSTLLGQGMNNPFYNIQYEGSTGYAKLTFPISAIPVADSGIVYIKIGKPYPGNLIPAIARSGYVYEHPVYGTCLRLQFFQGLDKPGGKKK